MSIQLPTSQYGDLRIDVKLEDFTQRCVRAETCLDNLDEDYEQFSAALDALKTRDAVLIRLAAAEGAATCDGEIRGYRLDYQSLRQHWNKTQYMRKALHRDMLQLTLDFMDADLDLQSRMHPLYAADLESALDTLRETLQSLNWVHSKLEHDLTRLFQMSFAPLINDMENALKGLALPDSRRREQVQAYKDEQEAEIQTADVHGVVKPQAIVDAQETPHVD